MFLEVIRDGACVEKLTRHFGHQIGANMAAQMRMETAAGWMGPDVGDTPRSSSGVSS
jgi:hypothetical protein